MVWSPPSYSAHSAQSIHALTPSSTGAPDGPAVHATPANLSTPDRANTALTSSCSAASTLTQNAPTARIRGHVVEVRAGARLTSGGSSDNDVNDWQVKPSGPSLPAAVTTTMPDTKWPSTSRITAGETGPIGASRLMPRL